MLKLISNFPKLVIIGNFWSYSIRKYKLPNLPFWTTSYLTSVFQQPFQNLRKRILNFFIILFYNLLCRMIDIKICIQYI